VKVENDWLTRYRRGQREQVWYELRCLGDRVRQPEYIEAARSVCDEMASRARKNIETLVERLSEQGYVFHSNDNEQHLMEPFIPATSRAEHLADWLDAALGPIPLTLAAWLRHVGDVWLVGNHPAWPESVQADPLVIQAEGSHFPQDPVKNYFLSEFEAWEDSGPVDCPFVLPLAPDRLHKANLSGGPTYGIRLPDACTDGLFIAETTMPFVAYLNWVFAGGGFPARVGGPDRWRVLAALREDMLPL
jgi:hypothetical protein